MPFANKFATLFTKNSYIKRENRSCSKVQFEVQFVRSQSLQLASSYIRLFVAFFTVELTLHNDCAHEKEANVRYYYNERRRRKKRIKCFE